MEHKLIVTDLDRTLLRTDKTLSPYTVQILQRCQAKGIRIAFATARSEKAAEPITAVFAPNTMISNGGALARQGAKTLYSRMLSQQTVNGLIRRLYGCPGIGYITLETPSGYFVNHPLDPHHRAWQNYKHAKFVDFSEDIQEDAYKLTLEVWDADLLRGMERDFPMVDILPFSNESWVRFAHKNAVKWSAVLAVAAHWQISPIDIVAFGDDYNDIEMLQSCGTGVAVGNAIEPVKAVAKHICGSNDGDGVAKWLEENAL